MMAGLSEPPMIVIVGPTASGKSSLAMRLAQEFDGEIISADSRAIYKGLTIGTAKPSQDDQARVKHWGVDLVDPGEKFTAKDFQEYAYSAINDIRSRGKVPLLVGGTGLYIDAVLYNYTFSTRLDSKRRSHLEAMNIAELHKYCNDNNIKLPENKLNKRYVINTILRNGTKHQRRPNPLPNTIVVGITTDKDILNQRIAERAKDIISRDVYSEARLAGTAYGWNNEAMTGNIYKLMDKNTTYAEFIGLYDDFVRLDRQLAKRQLTWFKRSEHIYWLNLDDAYTYCARLLAKMNNT